MKPSPWLLVVLGTLAACREAPSSSSPSGAPGTHAVERASLRSAGGLALRERRIVAELTPDSSWLPAPDAVVRPLKPSPQRGPFLHLEHGIGLEAGSPVIPLDTALGGFNRVEFDITIKQAALHKRSTVIVATAIGERLTARELAPVPFGGGVHRLIIDLPYEARWAGRPESLRIGVSGAERWALGGVRLVEDDWAARLPLPESPAPLSLSRQTRPAVGLSSVRPVEASLLVPPNAELRLAFGVPQALVSPERPVLVTRILRGGDTLREVRTPLPDVSAASEDAPFVEAWHDLQIPLQGYEGQLSARFELEVEGRLPAYAALAVPLVTRRAQEAPKVLLVSSDTHRYDHVQEARAGVELETPALDLLASQGVFFEGCFTSTNVTNPSHAALMTGVHPRDTRVLDNLTALAGDASTLAEVFQQAGFVTLSCVSVPHLDHPRSGLGQGFDRMSAPMFKKRPAEASIDELTTWLDEAQDLPVFAWLHLFDAHTPYGPPGEFDRRYYPDGRDPYDPSLPAPPRHQLPPEDGELRDLTYPAAQYKAEVTYLGHALAGLFERPAIRAGVVLFTADHGESLGAHGIYWGHGGLYPDTVHVPLILRYPGAPAGTRVATPVRQIDAGRTLLDLAGLTSTPFAGTSLLEALDEPADASPQVAPTARYLLSSDAHEAAVHDGPWLLILCLFDHQLRGGPEYQRHQVELYHLAQDPGCLNDRSVTELETARRLRKQLVEWLGARREIGWNQATAAGIGIEDELRALGYTTSAVPRRDDAPWIDPDCACERCAVFR